ncbi:MAG TPA: 3-deoxy-manno-octulosonate cytidylyltransferase [Woeseiaceae bacterium]
MSDFIVVIPSRYGSTRLPGKPLREIRGKTMMQRVHESAMASGAIDVVIATDDIRIRGVAEGFGAKVCMTSRTHESGTERIAEVSQQLGWADEQVVVNLQGDEPMMPPALIAECAGLLDDGEADIATLASPLEHFRDWQDPNVVKVVTDREGRALYFSRASIPFARDTSGRDVIKRTALQHHGIYAYRCAALRRFVAAGSCEIEQLERLEQLRALWLGMHIRVGIASQRPGPGVDTEENLRTVSKMLEVRE